MNTFLFIDGWMIDRMRDMVMCMGKPELTTEAPWPARRGRVVYDPEVDRYRFYRQKPLESGPYLWDGQCVLCLEESDDGITWHDVPVGGPRDPRVPEMANVIHLGHQVVYGSPVFDQHDPDPKRRYKMVVSRPGIQGALATSYDGMRWSVDWEHPMFDIPGGVSDTDNHVIYNPVTGRLQCILRPAYLDRRVAIIDSEDGLHWRRPCVILHPDRLDEELVQFYGMPHFYYDDVFIGFLWRMHTVGEDTNMRIKWLGNVDTALAYSYNGVHWFQTDRRAFVPRTPPEHGYGAFSIYTTSLVMGRDGILRLYSLGGASQHVPPKPLLESQRCLGSRLPEMPLDFGIVCHTLRRDGFAYVEPRGGWGYLAMKALIPLSPEIRLNFRAPTGMVLVQVSDGKYEPVQGYSFDDCLPLSGDNTEARVQWKHDKDLSCLVEKSRQDPGIRWRLEIKLFQAELYAVRWESYPGYSGYGNYPKLVQNLG